MLIVLSVGDVLPRPRLAILLGQAEIDHIHKRLGWGARGHDKIGRLDVAMDETP